MPNKMVDGKLVKEAKRYYFLFCPILKYEMSMLGYKFIDKHTVWNRRYVSGKNGGWKTYMRQYAIFQRPYYSKTCTSFSIIEIFSRIVSILRRISIVLTPLYLFMIISGFCIGGEQIILAVVPLIVYIGSIVLSFVFAKIGFSIRIKNGLI